MKLKGDIAGAGVESLGRVLLDRLLECDVGVHIAAALPGRHVFQNRVLAIDHAGAGRAEDLRSENTKKSQPTD